MEGMRLPLEEEAMLGKYVFKKELCFKRGAMREVSYLLESSVEK